MYYDGLVNGTRGITASAIKTAKRVVAMLVEFADVSIELVECLGNLSCLTFCIIFLLGR